MLERGRSASARKVHLLRWQATQRSGRGLEVPRKTWIQVTQPAPGLASERADQTLSKGPIGWVPGGCSRATNERRGVASTALASSLAISKPRTKTRPAGPDRPRWIRGTDDRPSDVVEQGVLLLPAVQRREVAGEVFQVGYACSAEGVVVLLVHPTLALLDPTAPAAGVLIGRRGIPSAR